ncbi:MAG: LuxR family transcriptional regulator [Alphaproteobacteria bacterium]|nr:LuxR family transcriptional regulator [Alphaproteobacteria bacterium]
MASTLNNSVLDTLQSLERAPSVLKVKEAFRVFAEGHGHTSFMCTDPPRPDSMTGGAILFDEWPSAWRRRYLSRKYVHRDPMVLELTRTISPFTWQDVTERRTYPKADWEIVSEASAWDMRAGFVVPLHLPGGRIHAMTMAGIEPRTDLQARAELHLVSMYAHARASSLKKGEPEETIRLTKREREVLRFVATGKSDWEVAKILGVSSNAVHKHVENVKRRFGVGTRMQAVVRAIRQGDVVP